MDPIHEIPLKEASIIGDVVKWDDEAIKDLSFADAAIVRTAVMDKDTIDAMPNLKIIAKHGIGTDNIDLEYAKSKGIVVTNTPTANMESVAELAVSLILACARAIPYAYDLTKSGLERSAPKELTGIELGGKTVGLIGLGRIGQKVGSILKNGFGMTLCGFDPYMSFEKAKVLGITLYEDISEMLKVSDVVSISVPLTPDTTNLISKNEFSVMKNSAILVNTSRGKIVNEDALFNALQNRIIRAAALDVFEIEPPRTDNPLFGLPNFIGTPHIGAATEEALIRMGMTSVDEIRRYFNNANPQYVVNK